MRKVYILLPCYNEAENIPRLIESIHQSLSGAYDYTIVAVDDGSNDRTATVLEEFSKRYPVKVLKHEKNMGLSEALRTLIKYCVQECNPSDVAVVMDCDATHDPRVIPIMMNKVNMGCDVAVASRYVDGAVATGVPLTRRLLSRGLSVLARLTLGLPVRDVSSGYRAYRVMALRRAVEEYGVEGLIEARGFEAQFELLFKLYIVGAHICEAPIKLHYEAKKGSTKLKLLSTIKRYLILLHRLRMIRRYYRASGKRSG
ncbi:MAG TPA: glycosyltransferase [Pyrodictium sp.]|nr:glycosyltransferase [Pyrodictium sp.]